jgi:diguanylate cyclase
MKDPHGFVIRCTIAILGQFIVLTETGRGNMDNTKSVEEDPGYIRLALPLMSKYNIPITPKNYSVWYKYVSCADKELNRTIDAMRDQGEAFFEEKNERLYWRFCAEKDEHELRKLREDLQQILVTILREVTELTGQTHEYESFVSNSVNMLSDNASIHDIRNVISEIIDKTKTLGGYGKTISHKLKKTTEELEGLKKDFEQIKTEASMDFLTGIPNRKTFDDMLASYTVEATTQGGDLTLLLIDIDDFKQFNDQHGHLTGDEVLKFMAKKTKEIVRGRDFLARFGGEEFAVLLPHTPLSGAAVVAESIRNFFAQTTLKSVASSKRLGSMTVSIGVACYRPGEPLEHLINRSDLALYSAKNNGKNRVMTESDAISAHNHSGG